jgi:hypothetical protein
MMGPGDRAADLRFLVSGRAGQFTASFAAVPGQCRHRGGEDPAPKPRANADAKRFALTARTEVTGRTLIFGEPHPGTVLAGYARHHNRRRPHHGRQLRPPRPDHPTAGFTRQPIKRRPALGGPISEYERAAQKPMPGPAAQFWNPTG